jgi:hypothetical protein
MEEAPQNGNELSHSAQGNGMNEWFNGAGGYVLIFGVGGRILV